MLHWIIIGISIVLIMIGLLTAVMPIPGGVLPAVVGLTLLIYYSPKAKMVIHWLRLRGRWIDRMFDMMERLVRRYCPNMGRRLAETKPTETRQRKK